MDNTLKIHTINITPLIFNYDYSRYIFENKEIYPNESNNVVAFTKDSIIMGDHKSMISLSYEKINYLNELDSKSYEYIVNENGKKYSFIVSLEISEIEELNNGIKKF